MDIVYLRLLLRRLQCLFDPTRTWTLCNPLKRKQKAEMSLDSSFPKYKRTRIDCNIKKEYEQSTFCDLKINLYVPKLYPFFEFFLFQKKR